ncbi:unnamed protein product, partial [Brassica napus]
ILSSAAVEATSPLNHHHPGSYQAQRVLDGQRYKDGFRQEMKGRSLLLGPSHAKGIVHQKTRSSLFLDLVVRIMLWEIFLYVALSRVTTPEGLKILDDTEGARKRFSVISGH